MSTTSWIRACASLAAAFCTLALAAPGSPKEAASKVAPASRAPDGDGASYDGEAVHLTWGEALAPLAGKEMRVYRRAVGEGETLAGTTRETAFVDGGVAPDRNYVYRIVPLGADGKESKVSVSMEASTVVVSHVVVGEFKIHFQQGFNFRTRQVVPAGEADLALTDLAGGFLMRGFSTPYGGTNGPEEPGQLAPLQGLGAFEDLAEIPAGTLRTTLRADERDPRSLEVFALRTKGGGIAKVRVIGPEKGFTGDWKEHPFWIRYVCAPAGDRFLPTLAEVKSWPVELSEADRKKAEEFIRDLSAETIEARAQAVGGLRRLGPAALPLLRQATAPSDFETRFRLAEASAELARQCVPLQLALATSDRDLRDAAAAKLRAWLGEASPPEFQGEGERRRLEEKFEREKREHAARLRKAKTDAVRKLFPLSDEDRKKVETLAAQWRQAQGDGREAPALEIVRAGPGSAAAVADVLGVGEDAAGLIDPCLAGAKNLTFIDSPSVPEPDRARTCYFSFFSGKHGYNGMVSIEFGNGGDVFQVQMYAGQKNLVADLGKVDFAGVSAPKEFGDRKDWDHRCAAVVGHTYLEYVWENDQKFYVKFKVLALESGQWALLHWERLDP